MSLLTSFLGLFKYNTATDGNMTFNIDTAINEPLDAIDAAIEDLTDGLNSISCANPDLSNLSTAGQNVLNPDNITFTASGTETLTLYNDHVGAFTGTKVLNLPTVPTNKFGWCWVSCTMTAINQLTFGSTIEWDNGWNPIGNFRTDRRNVMLLYKPKGQTNWSGLYKFGGA